MALGLTIKFLGTIVELALPMILSFMIDDVVPMGDRGMIDKYGGVMFLCALTALVGNILANRVAARVARDTMESLRSALFTRISYLSSRQVDSFTVPSLESRLTSDTYNLHQTIGMMQRMGVRAPILLIGGIMSRLRWSRCLRSYFFLPCRLSVSWYVSFPERAFPCTALCRRRSIG